MGSEAAQGGMVRPPRVTWDLSRGELIADGVVHLIGLIFAISAGSILLALAFFRTDPGEYAATILYVASLVTVLSVSMLYNLWPVTPAKWVLRRIDHSAIYLLIAGTYTPFLVQLPEPAQTYVMMSAVWIAAGAGIALKVFLPGRYDRLAVAFYLAMGWSGVVIAGEMQAALPASTLTLLAAGGLVYTFGVAFYLWRGLKYKSAVWHTFVVLAAALHCLAVIDCFVLNRM